MYATMLPFSGESNSFIDQANRIDVLVNNAGMMMLGAVEETSLTEAASLFDTNVFGILRTNQGSASIYASAELRKNYQYQLGARFSSGSISGYLCRIQARCRGVV